MSSNDGKIDMGTRLIVCSAMRGPTPFSARRSQIGANMARSMVLRESPRLESGIHSMALTRRRLACRAASILSADQRFSIGWRSKMMRTWTSCLGLLLVIIVPVPSRAQSVGEVFRRVNPSVVIIRARWKEPAGAEQVAKVSEIGSGFLISADGQVITAAHV